MAGITFEDIKPEIVEHSVKEEPIEFVDENQFNVNIEIPGINMEFGWFDERVLQLINEIKEFPCLWDPKDKDRKNKHKKNDCYRIISLKLGTSVEAICKKFSHLLQTYRACRRKMKSLKGSGTGKRDGYKPMWFAYDSIHQFMEDVYMPYGASETMDDDNESDMEKSEKTTAVIDSNIDDAEENSGDVVNIIDDQETNDTRRVNLKKKVFLAPNKLMKAKRRATDELDVRINEVYEYVVKRKKEDSKNDKEDEECAIFGNLVATKLRKMDEVTRQYVMNDLTNILYQAAILGSLRSSQLTTSISPPYTITPQRSSSSLSHLSQPSPTSSYSSVPSPPLPSSPFLHLSTSRSQISPSKSSHAPVEMDVVK